MNKLKIFLALIMLFGIPLKNWGQVIEISYRDVALIGLKKTIVAEITGVSVQKRKIRRSYFKLRDEEKNFHKKLNPSGKAVINAGIAADKVKEAVDLVDDLQDRLDIVMNAGFRMPSWKRIQGELDEERKYMEEIENDMGVLSNMPILVNNLSGGEGFAVTYFRKIVLRTEKILTKLYELEYRTRNLGIVQRVMQK